MWICFVGLRIRTNYELVGLKMTDSFLTSLAFVSCSKMFVLHAVQVNNVLCVSALICGFDVLVKNIISLMTLLYGFQFLSGNKLSLRALFYGFTIVMSNKLSLRALLYGFKVVKSNMLSLRALCYRFKLLVSNVLSTLYVYNIFTGKIQSESCKILPTPRMNFVISYHSAR